LTSKIVSFIICSIRHIGRLSDAMETIKNRSVTRNTWNDGFRTNWRRGGEWRVQGGDQLWFPTIHNYLKCPFRIRYTIIRLCIESARVTNKLIACQSGSPMSNHTYMYIVHVCVNINLSINCLGVYIQINEINMTCDFFYTFTRLWTPCLSI